MDLIQHLHIFLRVADSGSFSRAAVQLGMAASSVTSAIQRLEVHLGARLFLRTTRQVQLSSDGERLRDRAPAVLAEADGIQQLFRKAETPSGVLRVDAPARMVRGVLIPALPGFLSTYPQVRVDMGGSDRISDPLAEGIDCVLRVGELGDLNLVARPLGQLQQVTCGAPSLLRQYPPLSELASCIDLPAVYFGRLSASRAERFEFLTANGPVSYALQGRVAVTSAETYIECARQGLGLIQVPRYDVAGLLASGELVEVFADTPPPALPFTALYLPQQRASPLVKLFIDWVEALMLPYVQPR